MEKIIVLFLVLASCSEAVVPEPNITLEFIEEATLPHRNTYNYWIERSDVVNKSVYYWGDKLCNELVVVDTNTYIVLVYEHELCFDKLTAMYGLFMAMYGLHTYCDDPKEARKIKYACDSLELIHVKFKAHVLVADKVLSNLSDYVQSN